jgi:hypothetical protein
VRLPARGPALFEVVINAAVNRLPQGPDCLHTADAAARWLAPRKPSCIVRRPATGAPRLKLTAVKKWIVPE